MKYFIDNLSCFILLNVICLTALHFVEGQVKFEVQHFRKTCGKGKSRDHNLIAVSPPLRGCLRNLSLR
jgi:hypothetical protein